MNKHFFTVRTFGKFATAFALIAGLIQLNAADKPSATTNENFSAVSEAVVKLLETGDAAAFAKTVAPTLEDWQAANVTNHTSQKSVDHDRQKVESDARALVARAKELKLDFSKVQLSATPKSERRLTTIRYDQGETLPYAEQLEVAVSAKPQGNDPGARMAGEYKLGLHRVIKFQGGWRCIDGILWTAFPNSVVDEATQREVAILAKAANYKGFALAEDPAIGKLAELLAEFIRERDINIFETKAIMDVDTVLNLWTKQAASVGEKTPPRAEIEKELKEHKEDIVKPARAVLAVLEQGGIDLKGATIKVKSAQFGSSYPRTGAGIIDGLEGNGLHIVFNVQSDAKSKTGKSLSGEYELGAEESVRVGGKWFIAENLHWIKFPDGVLDEKTVKAIEFENYVAENNTLPPGTTAPDIEFVKMSDDKKMKLSDLRGKVVVLDFWDTGCGPCQQPLADLQKLKSSHPAWGDRVSLITMSIDGTMKKGRDHMMSRSWTNTFNTWAGPGGWKSAPATQFRVTGIPTTYIIDPNGKIIEAGHPVGLQIPEHVDELLAAGSKP